ncbi:potassium transporter TrkG [Streptomyces sp. NPDC054802]
MWLGVFHAVTAFNNAGFALYSDSLMGFVTDPWICLPITAAVIAGGLGFPVLFEPRRRWRRPRSWSLHTKILVWASCDMEWAEHPQEVDRSPMRGCGGESVPGPHPQSPWGRSFG